VRGNPDLWPFAIVRREIEHRVSKREERRITVDQFALRIPQGADGGQGLFEPGNRFRPVDTVGFVADALPGTDAENRPSARHQVQCRGGLRGHGGVAFTGVRDADAEPHAIESPTCRKAAEQSPRLHRGVR
jgi:hypothetical protein